MSGDERIFAWLDGELDAAEAAEVEARVRADPELARLAEHHRAMQRRLQGAFDQVVDAPVPQALTTLAQQGQTVTRLEPARHAGASRKWGWAPASWLPLAATLAVGVVIGTMVPRGGDSPVVARDGALVAAADLDRALDTQLASAPDRGPVRIGLTFRDLSGAICRSFTQPGASGVACREGSDWRVHGLFAAPEGQSADYRMAAGNDPQLAAMIETMIAEDPFDAAQEKAAMDEGWRQSAEIGTID